MHAQPVPAPTFVTTTSGKPLPIVALPQTELLTLNVSDLPLVKDSLGPGVSTKLLRLDLEANHWVVLATFAPGVTIPIHYHTGAAEVYTLAGRWFYREYPDQPQTAGSYLYEPGGSVHTFYTPEDNAEDTVMLVMVTGANVNFTEDGAFHSILDATSIRYLADEAVASGSVQNARYISGSTTVIVGQGQGQGQGQGE